MSTKSFVTRFAPSPTGYLHLGHAFSALEAYREAVKVGGRFLLRIEDIDQTRCKSDFVSAIDEDLVWLGLDWEKPVRVQSAHFSDYRAVLDTLRADGLVYPCFCTRKDIAEEIAAAGGAPHGPDGPVYPGICRGLSETERADRIAAGAAHAWRLDMAKALKAVDGPLFWTDLNLGQRQADPARFGDVVLARKDCPTSYHLAVTHDDHQQGVTHIIRGVDLLEHTDVHVLLQRLLGYETPLYRHHRLLMNKDGKRLAKRDKAETLRSLRKSGVSAAEAIARMNAAPL